VHLASSTVPKTSNDDPIFDVHMNLVESIALLELCRTHDVRKIVFFSSGGTIYGVPTSLPVKEEHPTDPLCSYGIVKLAVEKYLHCFHALYGLQYVALRVSNAYGIRQNPASQQGVIPVFMRRVLHGEPVRIWGDGSVVRDFVAVRDVAALCATALLSEENGVFNAGSGAGVSINRILEDISAVAGREATIIREPARSFDVPAIVLDCEKARKIFGWSPKIVLKQGLGELAEWLRATSAS
jgi:UDP-glucose 4-epimerase